MSQIRREEERGETRHTRSQMPSRRHKRVSSHVHDNYLGETQSCSERASFILDTCKGSYQGEEAGDVLEHLEDGEERVGNDSEIECVDPDVNRSEENISIPAAQRLTDTEEESPCGFMKEVDAIRIVQMPEGDGWRCVVEEDLGQMYFRAKRGYPLNALGESSRTRIYRAIAMWLNALDGDPLPLSSPDMLLKAISADPMSQSDFCDKYEIETSTMSNVLKEAILEWPFGALPLKALFALKRAK